MTDLMQVPVQVTYGRSRSTPIQVRWNGKHPLIRFHHMFGEAPTEIVEAVAAWLKNGRRARRACTELDAWIHTSLELLPAMPRRQSKQIRAGNVHDLERLVVELCSGTLAEEFDGDAPLDKGLPGLTWGRRTKSRSRHTLQLGCYSPEQHLVRIHPVLDQEAVPAWFVRYVLFHELLHSLIPAKKVGSRRWRHHCPEFRKRESEYCDYQRALVWEKQNLLALIRSARSGKPIPVRKTATDRGFLEKLQGLLFPA